MSQTKKPSIPYANTTISADDSIADIKKLLKSHGIKDIQETTLAGKSVIRFIYHTEPRDVSFEIKPPTLTAPKRSYNAKKGKYEMINFPMENQAWRLVYWYLETKLKAVQYGLVSIEREFLNQMLTGDDKTVGDLIIQKLEQDKGILKLEEPTATTQRKSVDIDYKVVG